MTTEHNEPAELPEYHVTLEARDGTRSTHWIEAESPEAAARQVVYRAHKEEKLHRSGGTVEVWQDGTLVARFDADGRVDEWKFTPLPLNDPPPKWMSAPHGG